MAKSPVGMTPWSHSDLEGAKLGPPETINDHEPSFLTQLALLSIVRNCLRRRWFHTIPIAACVLFNARLSDVPLSPIVRILRHARAAPPINYSTFLLELLGEGCNARRRAAVLRDSCPPVFERNQETVSRTANGSKTGNQVVRFTRIIQEFGNL